MLGPMCTDTVDKMNCLYLTWYHSSLFFGLNSSRAKSHKDLLMPEPVLIFWWKKVHVLFVCHRLVFEVTELPSEGGKCTVRNIQLLRSKKCRDSGTRTPITHRKNTATNYSRHPTEGRERREKRSQSNHKFAGQWKQTGSTSPSPTRAPWWRHLKTEQQAATGAGQGHLCLEKGTNKRVQKHTKETPSRPHPSPQSNRRRHLKRPPLWGALPRQPISVRAEVNSAPLPARRGAALAEGAVGATLGQGRAAGQSPPLRLPPFLLPPPGLLSPAPPPCGGAPPLGFPPSLSPSLSRPLPQRPPAASSRLTTYPPHT